MKWYVGTWVDGVTGGMLLSVYLLGCRVMPVKDAYKDGGKGFCIAA